MNKVIVVIGIIICLSGVILFAIVLSQPPTNENPVRRNPNELPDVLYFTPILPIFVLSAGIWMIAVGSKR
jgi:energy-converting hydrogenase Eha subunit A